MMIIALIALLSLLPSSPATSLPSDAHPLVKRFDDAQFIRHDTTGVLACGDLPHSEDEITNLVAVSPEQWDDGSHCQQGVFILIDGIESSGIVVDICSDCENTGLGLNPNFFGSFEDYDPSVQALNGSWAFERPMPRRA